MDQQSGWSQAKQDLNDASKRFDALLMMPRQMRSMMSAAEYQRRRSQAYKAVKSADRVLREANVAVRQAARSGVVGSKV